MFTAIGKAFHDRFPFAHISICQKVKDAFSCVFASGTLDTPAARALSEQALAPFADTDLTKPLFVEKWSESAHLRLAWPKSLSEDPCWIAIPLQADNATIAIVQLFAPRQAKTIFEQEQTLLSTLAAHAAACLSN